MAHTRSTTPSSWPPTPTCLIAEVATAADETARPTFITAVIDESDPWQLVHLQWTPAAPTNPERKP